MSFRKSRAGMVPKRRIRRVRKGIGAIISTSILELFTFVASDPLTITRILIQGSIVVNPGTVGGSYEMLLDVRPKDKQVAPAATVAGTSVLDVDKNEILRHRGELRQVTDVGSRFTEHIFIDTKAQRKMEREDVLELEAIGATTTALKVVMNMYVWFKEV